MPAFPSTRFVQPVLNDSSNVVRTASLEKVFCSLTELTSGKDFLVISLNFLLLAFILLLISYNPLARFSSVKLPSKAHFQHITVSHSLASYPSLSLPITHHFPGQAGPMCYWCYPTGTQDTLISKASIHRAGRSVSEFTGASKNSGQDPANSIPGEIRLLGSQDCLLCSQL